MKHIKQRLIAMLLSVVMLVTPVAGSVTVLAEENLTGTQLTASAQKGSWVSTIFSLAGKACVTKAVSWGLDGFMNAMFGAETTEEQKMLDEIQEQLTTVLSNQDKILDELSHLESIIEVQSYMQIINEYTKALNLCQSFFTCYDTLGELDKTYAGNPDALKIQRLRTLTGGLDISNMTSINTDADKNYLELYNAFVGPHKYTVNGEVKSGDLFDVYREIKRYQYCWENEAWDEMEAFFEYAASCYALISSVEMSSVQARIELCDENNQGKAVTDPDYWSTASLQTWLHTEKGTSANSDLESRIAAGNTVYENHPVTRQNIYRHYWKPGYEMLFYTQVKNLGDHPVDEPLVGKGGTSAGSMFKNAEGLYMKGSGKKATLNDAFWNQFYDSKTYPDANLVTTAEINKLLDGCNHSKTLSEIIKAGDFIYSAKDADALSGLVLKKEDEQNPFYVNEKHEQDWQEYIGTLYFDDIKPYVRYIPMTQQTKVNNGGAANYGTYRYYHNDDSPVRWNIQNNYTAGSLGQLFVCESSCMHERLKADESTAIESTCSKAGKAADLVCPDCGIVFTGETLPKLPHTSASEDWLHDNNYHWMICDVCGEKYDVSTHMFSGGGFITGVFICSTCGYIYMSSGPILGKPKDETTSQNHQVNEQKTQKIQTVSTGLSGESNVLPLVIGCVALAVAGAVILIIRKK